MTRPLDYLAVVGWVGSKLLTACVETETLIAVIGPDAEPYLIVAEPCELPVSIIEWVDTLGTVVHHGTPCHVYWVTDEFAEHVGRQDCFCGSGQQLGECHAKAVAK